MDEFQIIDFASKISYNLKLQLSKKSKKLKL